MLRPSSTLRRWTAVLAVALLVVGASTAALVGGGAGAQTAPTCSVVKGQFTQWDGSTPGTGVGVFKGSITGSYTSTLLTGSWYDPPDRMEFDLVMVPKKGSPYHLLMHVTGTNFTSRQAVAGGWIQTPPGSPAPAVYYLSIALEPGPGGGTGGSADPMVWVYTGQACNT